MSRTLRDVRRTQGSRAAMTLGWRYLTGNLRLGTNHLRARAHRRTALDILRLRRSRDGNRSTQVAVAITGGLGDAIVIARFLRDLARTVPGLQYDIFAPRPDAVGLALAGVPEVQRLLHDALFESMRSEYDVALRINQMIVVHTESTRLRHLRRTPALLAILGRIIESRPEFEDFIARHPHRDNLLARMVSFQGRRRHDFLHHVAGIRYGGDQMAAQAARDACERFGLTAGEYITVHNGFDPTFPISGTRATKCYPHFGAVVRQLRQARPDLQFVQLGTSTSEALAECDVNLLNRTTLLEASGLLAGALLHIDNEGGLVHLARCHDVPSAVVFGPTPSAFFGYRANINIDPAVCGDCWWMTRDWMSHCAKGFSVPRCLHEQPPDIVAQRILAVLHPPVAPQRGWAADPAEPRVSVES